MAGAFSRRLQAFCANQGIPIIEAQARDRKHELAEAYLPKDPNFCGLFLVIKSIATAPVWEVNRNAQGQITEIRHRKNWPFVRHFYFHLIDPEWGHVTIRMCDYPPFGAQVILNGHEWWKRQARRKRVAAIKDGNCFVDGSDFAGIDRLAAELNRPEAIGRLRRPPACGPARQQHLRNLTRSVCRGYRQVRANCRRLATCPPLLADRSRPSVALAAHWAWSKMVLPRGRTMSARFGAELDVGAERPSLEKA